jgi:hypothetical protein
VLVCTKSRLVYQATLLDLTSSPTFSNQALSWFGARSCWNAQICAETGRAASSNVLCLWRGRLLPSLVSILNMDTARAASSYVLCLWRHMFYVCGGAGLSPSLVSILNMDDDEFERLYMPDAEEEDSDDDQSSASELYIYMYIYIICMYTCMYMYIYPCCIRGGGRQRRRPEQRE